MISSVSIPESLHQLLLINNSEIDGTDNYRHYIRKVSGSCICEATKMTSAENWTGKTLTPPAKEMVLCIANFLLLVNNWRICEYSIYTVSLP